MGYTMEIKNAVRIKYKNKTYPWPCNNKPNRTIEIFEFDVLTKEDNGNYMKHTGLGCFNIQIPDEDTIPFEKNPVLRIN